MTFSISESDSSSPSRGDLYPSFVSLAIGETVVVVLLSLFGDSFLLSLPFGGECDSGCFCFHLDAMVGKLAFVSLNGCLGRDSDVNFF